MFKGLWLVVAILGTLPLSPALQAQQSCPVSDTGDLLLDKLPVLKAAIPRRYETTLRNGFAAPSASEMIAWKNLTTAMVQGDLPAACAIIAANSFPYTVIEFTDWVTTKTYNILQEDIPPTEPIAKGWGTYIFNPLATNSLSIQVPHPLFDSLTPEEGVDAFRQLDARTLLMAGTHRYATNVQSSCQPDPNVAGNNADVAHNIENMFEPAHEVLSAQPLGTVFIQIHGNGSASCPDVFISNGTTSPGPRVTRIVECLQADPLFDPSGLDPFTVEAATPTSMCILRGTTNVQGRFSHGSANPCTQAAESASESFIHIEQSFRMRDTATANRQALIDALRCALLP
jgi:hypothetical protein